MKEHTFLRTRTLFFAFALTLITGVATESRVYAQGPCPINLNSPNRHIVALSQQILILESQGASVTCDNTSMYVTFPSGVFFSLSAPDGLPVSMFAFDPVTGRTTYWYILGGIDDPPTLLINDSVYGWINAGDGWFSIFYPIGNPFDAAIQNPFEAMMAGWGAPPPDPWGISEPPPRPQPIQP